MWRVRKQTLGGRGRGLPGRCKGPTVGCVLSGSWKDNVFWPRGQRGVDVCDKALSSFSCNIPSCLSSLAFIHPFIHSRSQQMNSIILWQAQCWVRIQQWICPQTLVPKMSQEKGKGCLGAVGSQRESFHLCHELPGWGWEEREFQAKENICTQVQRQRNAWQGKKPWELREASRVDCEDLIVKTCEDLDEMKGKEAGSNQSLKGPLGCVEDLRYFSPNSHRELLKKFKQGIGMTTSVL